MAHPTIAHFSALGPRDGSRPRVFQESPHRLAQSTNSEAVRRFKTRDKESKEMYGSKLVRVLYKTNMMATEKATVGIAEGFGRL